jgi:ATP synthase I chain
MDHRSPDEQPEPPTGPDPDPAFYRRALSRIPRWIALVVAAALPFVEWHGGPIWVASFLAGSIGGYWNYVAVCRVADRLSQTVERTGRTPRSSLRSALRLMFIAVAAFVIIRFTRINLVAAFTGLLTPVAAVVLEILYELASQKS